MKSSEIYKVEQALDVELPEPYRQFLAQYPAELRGTDAARWEVLDDADRITSINRMLDASHVAGWPDSFLAIGESGCGDYYGIDLHETDGEIYFWNHETAEIDRAEGFLTIEKFAGRFLQMYTSLEFQAATRKWWRFWKI